MSVRKLAISVPEDVVEQVDRAAKRAKTTRSAFITDILRLTASAQSEAEIRRRIRHFFEDPEIVRDQRRSAGELARLRPEAGTEW